MMFDYTYQQFETDAAERRQKAQEHNRAKQQSQNEPARGKRARRQR